MTALTMRTAFKVALEYENRNYTPDKAHKLNQIADDMTVEILRREYEEQQDAKDNARA